MDEESLARCVECDCDVGRDLVPRRTCAAQCDVGSKPPARHSKTVGGDAMYCTLQSGDSGGTEQSRSTVVLGDQYYTEIIILTASFLN